MVELHRGSLRLAINQKLKNPSNVIIESYRKINYKIILDFIRQNKKTLLLTEVPFSKINQFIPWITDPVRIKLYCNQPGSRLMINPGIKVYNDQKILVKKVRKIYRDPRTEALKRKGVTIANLFELDSFNGVNLSLHYSWELSS